MAEEIFMSRLAERRSYLQNVDPHAVVANPSLDHEF
jgi:hypothetical protein